MSFSIRRERQQRAREQSKKRHQARRQKEYAKEQANQISPSEAARQGHLDDVLAAQRSCNWRTWKCFKTGPYDSIFWYMCRRDDYKTRYLLAQETETRRKSSHMRYTSTPIERWEGTRQLSRKLAEKHTRTRLFV